MRPLEAAYVNGRFSFAFDSIYTYGEGLASLGTYAPVSNDTAASGSASTATRYAPPHGAAETSS